MPKDPFYEMIPHPRKPGKMKKVKKQVPAYIPEHDANILAKSRKTAYRLDFCLFNFLGFRFGWASVIGLAPVVGDFMDGFLAWNLIRHMNKVEGGLPGSIRLRMYIYLFIDLLVGLVPFVGDLADAYVKANGKNVRLLEQHLDMKYKPKSVLEEEEKMEPRRRPRPATIYEDFSDEEEERRAAFDDRYDDVRQPQRAYSGRRERVPDEEMGIPRHGTHKSHRSHRDSDRPSRNNTRNSRR